MNIYLPFKLQWSKKTVQKTKDCTVAVASETLQGWGIPQGLRPSIVNGQHRELYARTDRWSALGRRSGRSGCPACSGRSGMDLHLTGFFIRRNPNVLIYLILKKRLWGNCWKGKRNRQWSCSTLRGVDFANKWNPTIRPPPRNWRRRMFWPPSMWIDRRTPLSGSCTTSRVSRRFCTTSKYWFCD